MALHYGVKETIVFQSWKTTTAEGNIQLNKYRDFIFNQLIFYFINKIKRVVWLMHRSNVFSHTI
jgi:hypothetical protein